ncbi:MAG TPA: hypothetical protein VOA41_09510 [Candidatus Dormibacteraeota bacterium]|nr:hypothetical protein [Candidatus Dormibacteraeota bacterium]
MTDTIIYVSLAVVLLLILLMIARGRRQTSEPATHLLPIEELFPRHAWHFAQIRQMISEADLRFLAKRASPECCRRVQKERAQIIRKYVKGLREDFERLERLGRTVAALSPKVSHGMELERLWLSLRFRFVARLLWVRMELGVSYARPLEQLTKMIAGLASETDALLAGIDNLSAQTQDMI